MRFKDDRMKEEFWRLDPKLKLILCDADYFAVKHGLELTVTCLMRTDSEQAALYDAGLAPSPSSVHCFGRGADIRLFDEDKYQNINILLESYIEGKYQPYDPQRLHKRIAMIHGGTGQHLHIQVMPTTKEE